MCFPFCYAVLLDRSLGSFFSIRIYASANLYCLSPTGECVLKFSPSINLSVRYKFIARLNFGRTPMPFVRWGGS